MSYINRMRSVQFHRLSSLTKQMSQWCEKRDLFIFASYTESNRNTDADRDPRRVDNETEFGLKREVFQEMCILLSFDLWPRYWKQHRMQEVFLLVQGSRGGICRRIHNFLSSHQLLCLPTFWSFHQGNSGNYFWQSWGGCGGSFLATPAVVPYIWISQRTSVIIRRSLRFIQEGTALFFLRHPTIFGYEKCKPKWICVILLGGSYFAGAPRKDDLCMVTVDDVRVKGIVSHLDF